MINVRCLSCGEVFEMLWFNRPDGLNPDGLNKDMLGYCANSATYARIEPEVRGANTPYPAG
jgi:hypothetical protein